MLLLMGHNTLNPTLPLTYVRHMPRSSYRS
jgi:hypothetical protein